LRSSTRRFGSRIKLAIVALGAIAAMSSCVYGFAGGGLPPHIRTVAILPFDNQTGEAALTGEIAEAVREAMERRLGLRLASEDQADAVVTGTISRYQADDALAYQSEGAGARVTRRLVRIVLSVEIYDRREDLVLWERGSLTVEGEFDPPESERVGRELALEKLVADIVDGAQSQW